MVGGCRGQTAFPLAEQSRAARAELVNNTFACLSLMTNDTDLVTGVISNIFSLKIPSRLKASLIANFENYEILTNSKFAANVNEKVNLIFLLK